MQMPTIFTDDILKVAESPPSPIPVFSVVFPPIGFFYFAETGNGDYFGYYWPIGREESPPLVAYSSHDAYALIPEHGDLLAAGRCQMARDEDCSLGMEFKGAFEAAKLPVPEIDFDHQVAVDDHETLLTLDPQSPFRNCALADQAVAKGDLEHAEAGYRKAINLLPEYGAAHFGLGYLLRRLRRPDDAAVHLRKSLICPLAFWGGCFWADHILPGNFRTDWARKALVWLQGIKNPGSSWRDDPFLSRINDLTLQTGVANSRDLELRMEMVDEYLQLGQPLDAVYMWITVGDLAALETTSFRERYHLTPVSYGRRLVELFQAAGLERRALLLENMLTQLEKPNGLYL